MGSRLELQSLLEETLGSGNVYFQPPPTVELKYPCIVYKRNRVKANFASNALYNYKIGYMVKVIGKDPDSSMLDKVINLPTCAFERHYTADNLNHDVYTIYY